MQIPHMLGRAGLAWYTPLRLTCFVALAATLSAVACIAQSVELPEPCTRARTERILLVEPPPERFDILFVVDTSPLMQSMRAKLVMNARYFASTLSGISGSPDLHIAVISSDMGTAGGVSAAGCSSLGDNGAFYTGGLLFTDGQTFLDDHQQRGMPGQRSHNFQGSLQNALVRMLSPPPSTCHYAQPMRAISRALFPLPGDPGSVGYQSTAGTAGFIRANATLVVVVISGNDDCSLAPAFLSQQIADDEATAFRCFADSITCDEAATTLGPHHNCWPNEKPGTLSATTLYKKLFQLKASEANVHSKLLVSLVTGVGLDPTSAIVVPGINVRSPMLAQACTNIQGSTGVVATPSLRLVEFASRFRNHNVMPICDEYIGDALSHIAVRFPEWSHGFGPRCFEGKLVEPFACAFTEYQEYATVHQRAQLLPLCDALKSNTPCVRIATDSVRCPAPTPGVSADFEAGRSEVFPGTVIGVECVTTD